MKAFLAVLLLACCSQSAFACNLTKLPWESYAADVAIVGDVATTMDCLHRNICHEANPFYGSRHPSDGQLIGVGLGRIALTTGAACLLEDRSPKAARLFSIISFGVNGGAFAANLRFTFR